jgi:RimJ/RimL family protein N-acetyltransferase
MDEIIYVTRDLDDADAAGADPFRYRSVAELGRAAFLPWFGRALAGTANGWVDAGDPAATFDALVAKLGAAAATQAWGVAALDGRPVGVIMPQVVPYARALGGMAFLGVFPEARGAGIGARLHAAGLGALARAGVRRYIDRTDARNHAMLRIFARNGCRIAAA